MIGGVIIFNEGEAVETAAPSETSEGAPVETAHTQEDIYNLLSDIKVINTALLMVCSLILFFSYFRRLFHA